MLKQRGKQLPQRWVTGPCPKTHDMYRTFIQQRNQANYRKEPWNFEFDDWKLKWWDNWDLKGRKKGQLCMSRIDATQEWHKCNVQILTREDTNNHIMITKRALKLEKALENKRLKEMK